MMMGKELNLKITNKGFVVFLFILPMWMNFMLRILAWQIILSNNGILNSILSAIGLPTIHILYTKSAVTLGMVYDFLPYMILLHVSLHLLCLTFCISLNNWLRTKLHLFKPKFYLVFIFREYRLCRFGGFRLFGI